MLCQRERSTPKERDRLLKAWNFRCGACRSEIMSHMYDDGNVKFFMEIDHFRALKNGGTNDIENLWPLCPTCHAIKTDAEMRRQYGGSFCILCKKFNDHLECFENRKLEHCDTTQLYPPCIETRRDVVFQPSEKTNKFGIFAKYAFKPNRTKEEIDELCNTSFTTFTKDSTTLIENEKKHTMEFHENDENDEWFQQSDEENTT